MENILVSEDIKGIIPTGGKRLSPLDYTSRSFEDLYTKMDGFRKGVSWHIPTQELIDHLIAYGPLVSVGSGYGYTESLAISKGVDIIATDINPTDTNGWCRDGDHSCDVENLEATEAIKKYNDRNVFMAWPPYDTPMAYNVASEMEVGNYLIYIGEEYGGCTGNDDFFEYLTENFEELSDVTIPRWDGIYDSCQIYRKLK